MHDFFTKKQSLNIKGELLNLTSPKVMGILNITPDSFYDGGNYTQQRTIEERLMEMQAEGADIIDIGAYSSRPNADNIASNEEIERLDNALSLIKKMAIDIPVSIDTFRSEVAAFALEKYQVPIINDISGGELDPQMFDVIGQHKPVYIMMHMRGTPQTMTSLTNYKEMTAEILLYFSKKIEKLKGLGVKDVVIDPGFGFAKTLDQNYELLSQLHLFKALETPLLVGLSRKSMIYKLLQRTPKESLNGTTGVNMLALDRGADILRVHDIQAAKECVKIFTQLNKNKR